MIDDRCPHGLPRHCYCYRCAVHGSWSSCYSDYSLSDALSDAFSDGW